MHRYEDEKTAAMSISSEGFYKSLESERGRNSNSFCSQVVTPTSLDFACDVEITARRVLNAFEYRVFQHVFLNQDPISELALLYNEEVVKVTAEKIKTIVGRAFVARKIHPASVYFQAKDLR